MNNCLTIKPFIQRSRKLYTVEDGLPSNNITAVLSITEGKAYIGTDKGLVYCDAKGIFPVALSKEKTVAFLYRDKAGTVWVGAGCCLFNVTSKKAKLFFTCDKPLVGMAEDGVGDLWLLADNRVYLHSESGFSPYINVNCGNARAISSFGDRRMFVAAGELILSLFGKRPRFGEIMAQNSGKPSDDVRDLACDGKGHVWIATDKGVSIYDMYNYWLTPDTTASLKRGSIRKIVLNGTTRYIGTDAGLYIETGTQSDFFSADRWLPDYGVTAIAPYDDNTGVWVGTKKGLALITSSLTTLEDKAEYFQDITEKYCVREGYVTKRYITDLRNPEDGTVGITDNDGLWTGVYLATESFRYAVTGSKDALAFAKRSCKALFKLYEITGISGFPARAYRRPGEDRYGDGNIEWHRVKDSKGFLEWKGETSSDEIVGHFYGLNAYYMLCATEAEKKKISDLLCSVADHIINNGYCLCDEDNKPTTWAHWSPERLNRNDAWYWEHGINSMEMLMILRCCFGMSGNKRYYDEYTRLIQTEHYALNAMQHKIDDCHVNHIDDNLGFLTAYVLLCWEDDEVLRGYYLSALHHHWDSQRIERPALWNIMYGALSGEFCDIENAVESLEELPADLFDYRMTNTLRSDLEWSSGQEKFDGRPQLTEPLKCGERPLHDNDSNPFLPDGGSGKSLHSGTFFLHPYWMGRYYKLFREEENRKDMNL